MLQLGQFQSVLREEVGVALPSPALQVLDLLLAPKQPDLTLVPTLQDQILVLAWLGLTLVQINPDQTPVQFQSNPALVQFKPTDPALILPNL